MVRLTFFPDGASTAFLVHVVGLNAKKGRKKHNAHESCSWLRLPWGCKRAQTLRKNKRGDFFLLLEKSAALKWEKKRIFFLRKSNLDSNPKAPQSLEKHIKIWNEKSFASRANNKLKILHPNGKSQVVFAHLSHEEWAVGSLPLLLVFFPFCMWEKEKKGQRMWESGIYWVLVYYFSLLKVLGEKRKYFFLVSTVSARGAIFLFHFHFARKTRKQHHLREIVLVRSCIWSIKRLCERERNGV